MNDAHLKRGSIVRIIGYPQDYVIRRYYYMMEGGLKVGAIR